MIAFLHTSSVHIERFETLVRKHNNTIPIQHFVNENLLSTALATGELDVKSFHFQIETIKKHSVQLIICTCTTYGELSEKVDNVERIDQPLIEYLVSNYSTIALAYSVVSTRAISKGFIERTAFLQNKKIEIIECDCTSSWQYFQEGDFENYEKSIAAQVRNLDTDVVFLAQASMEGAAQYLQNFKKEIYSIPDFGVKYFLEKLKHSNKC